MERQPRKGFIWATIAETTGRRTYDRRVRAVQIPARPEPRTNPRGCPHKRTAVARQPGACSQALYRRRRRHWRRVLHLAVEKSSATRPQRRMVRQHQGAHRVGPDDPLLRSDDDCRQRGRPRHRIPAECDIGSGGASRGRPIQRRNAGGKRRKSRRAGR